MTEQENYKLQYKLMGINARMEYITLKLYDEDLSETTRERYLKIYNELEIEYKKLENQFINEYVKKIRK